MAAWTKKEIEQWKAWLKAERLRKERHFKLLESLIGNGQELTGKQRTKVLKTLKNMR